ncbi:GDP-mannose 4,6-dehydratase, partial [bacterium]|nr:GDP-mannose 4,6-dehydratase [bacterium]
WGHAKDFVRAMWLILQQDEPDDFVIATGESHTVREFTGMAFAEAGIPLRFIGEGENEQGVSEETGEVLVEVDPKYYRPTEVEHLVGDPSKAREELGWSPEYGLTELLKEMVAADLQEARKQSSLRDQGYTVLEQHE